ncbi:gliding motility-associated C-terminal domain-containing protein [Tenacibaculum sp. MAR_2009_124]|uniref:PKD-like domain-containing protein n=1 Tax=Tenacibaculum sp. MAR_2009_124 TaxID=1250059 RepID=UPI00089C1A26|nr:PKD-like domain-containing protein [Tenacibaculum sp. MAR_2009_124]SEC17387.1 gliding motility-associated C-terminal domain-containing protein [Tenacibaculum sp. MAR_2009_124]
MDSDNDGCNDVIESGGIDANDDGILDGTGFDANGQVTGGSGGYDGVSGNETVATQVTVDATALVDQSVNTGDPTSFTITSATATSTSAYTGTPPATTPDYSDSGATDVSAGLVYQWQEDGVDLTTTGVYTGVTTSTLNISDVTGLSGKVYNLVVSHPNIGCVDVQNSARLTEIDPCTDGAIVGTPTANDPDGDGINNSCDLDDDNDGILDSDECGLVTLNINWADLGLTDVGISSASGQTIPDIGAVLGIPELNGIGITVKFSFTGSSTPASNLIGAVGSPWLGLANVIGGTRKIEVSFTKSFEKISLMYDGQFTDGEFVMCGPSGGVLLQPTGPISGIDITAQGVSNPVGGVGTTTTSFPRYEISNEANIEVISGISSGGISTSSQNGVLLQIKYRICDTDRDGIQNILDLDSDNDGCNDVIESGGIDANDDGILDGTGFDANGQVTGGSGGYDGVSGNETVATQVTVDATALVDQSVNTGDPTSFTITSATATSTSAYTGTPPATTPDYSDSGATDVSAGLVYQWQEDGVDLTTTGVYTGVTTSTLNISDVTGLSGKVYNLVVSHPNIGCVDVQNSARLTEIDPCTDGAIVGTPTANDPDGDGINNSCDLDDDNDGILDSDECGLVTLNINWADLGLTDVGISSASGQTIPDIGAVLGIPELNGIGITVKFSFTGSSTPASNLIGAVGSPWLGLANVIGGTRKIEVSFTKSFEKISLMYDGQFTDGEFVMCGPSGGVLLQPTGPISGIDITAQGVSNPVGGVGTTTTSFPRYEISNEANIEVISGISSGGISTSSQNGVLLQIKYRICDTDRDGIQNILDLDSDNDGCNDVIESGGIDANDDGILDGTGFDANGQVTGGSGGYDGVTGTEIVPTQVTVDATALVDQSVNTGDPTSFTITSATAISTSAYTGTPPATTPDYSDPGATDVSAGLVYQWQEDGVDLTNTGVYSGVTTSTLNISDVTGLSGKVYNLVVSHPNTGCVDVQNSATLTEVNPCTVGAIVGTPTANDPDADGINNSCDLDDDNDGILDINEMSTVSAICTFSATKNTALYTPVFSIPTPVPSITTLFTGVDAFSLPYFPDPVPSVTSTVTSSAEIIGASGSGVSDLTILDVYVDLSSQTNVQFQIISGSQWDHDYLFMDEFGNPSNAVEVANISTKSGTSSSLTTPINPTGTVFLRLYNFDEFNSNNGAIWWKSTENPTLQLLEGTTMPVCNNLMDIDTDGDGIPNRLDADSDNDGCNDVIESGGVDANDDGVLDGTGFDANGQVTGGSGGYDGVLGIEIVPTQVTVDATALVDQSVNTGDPTSFTITSATAISTSAYTGTAPTTTPDYSDAGATDVSAGLVYQWQEDGVNLTNTGVYSGVTTSTLNISNVTGLSGKVYNLVITHPNAACVGIQNSAILTESDPCSDGATIGTPTANDPDGDGINNVCDLDDDNDGILDDAECARVKVTPADLSTPPGGNASNYSITNDDISSLFGLPTGSIFVTITNGATNSAGLAWKTNATEGNAIFEFSGPYADLAFVTIAHGGSLAQGLQDGFIALDGVEYDFQTTLIDDYFTANTGNTYYVENPVGGTATSNGVRFEWIAKQPGAKRMEIFATGATGNSQYFVELRLCDADRDMVLDHLDVDSDNDGCNDVTESGGTDGDSDGILDGTGFDSNGQVTGGVGGYDGVNGNEVEATMLQVDTQPTDATICPEASTTFTGAASSLSTTTFTGTAPSTTPDYSGSTPATADLAYHWQEQVGGSGPWNNISDGGIYGGATTVSLTLTNVPLSASTNKYRLLVTSTKNVCASETSSEVTLTVNPEPVNSTPPTETVCSDVALNHDLTADVTLTGNTFSWSAADNVNVTGETTTVSTAANITDTLTNVSGSVQTVVYTITPTSAAGCAGDSYIYTVTVNPEPVNNTPPTDTVCSDVALNHDLTADVTFTGNTFSWSAADNANVTGETTSVSTATSITDTLTNTSGSVQTVVYTITPTGSNGCAGDSYTYTVTVNPEPFVATAPTGTVCSDVALSHDLTGDVNVAGTTFSWSAADNANVTGETTSASTATSITDTLTNTSGSVQTVVYTITPTSADGCVGDSYTYTVTVNPEPFVAAAPTDTVCSNIALTHDLTSDVNVAGTTFSWSAADNANVTGESLTAQTTSTIGDTLINTSNSVQTVVYTIIPTSSNGCLGSSYTYTVTLSPQDFVAVDPSDHICSNSSLAHDLTSDTPVVGTTFSWSAAENTDVTGETTSASTATSITDTLINTSNSVQTVVYTITPTSPDGCAGDSYTYTVTIDPQDFVATNPTVTITSGETLSHNLAADTSVAGTTFSWSAADNTNVTGETITSSTASTIGDALVNITKVNQTVVYSITPTSADGCTGDVYTLTVTILSDTDGDGVADDNDLDSDNDGILDNVEQNGDPNRDTDSDGIPDHLDLDSDGDGILDLVESGQDAAVVDANGDGVLDSTTDADNDGILDTADADDNNVNAGGSITPTDSDGDGTSDFQDVDSDNDGVSDLVEGGTDASLDANNDGILDDQTDTDGDGLADSVDPDNGGTAAGTPDTDGDGLPDYQDLDSDGDGINDVVEAGGADTDNNGQIDTGGTLLDGTNLPDSSGNGTSDVLEPNNPDLPGSLDANGDGVIDDQTDSDGDGIADSVDGLVGFGDAEQTDTDGDGIADIHDLDSDNDGILDSVEQNGDPNRDTDSDGILDHLDLDSDGDGILDLVESGQDASVVDTNGDGVLDSTTDADNDGILDTADNDDNDINAGGSTTPTDSDGDGMPDFQDTDSDNDGVSDLIEGGGDPSLDTDNDGVIDDQTDTDGDGLADSVDPDNGGTSSTGPDTDGDGLPDYQDLDSDGDGINDVDEAGGTDTDGDGQIDTGDLVDGNNLPDTDGDGTPDVEEPNNPDLPGNLDLDGDGVIDDQTDSDGDGIADSVDGLVGFGDALTTDTDGDGIEDLYDLDSDNDGILDSVEQGGDPDRDTDGDGIPDHLDLDSDGDGILDIVESGQDAATLDADGDGMLDSTIDADNDGIVDTADNDDNDINAGGSTTPTDSDGDGMPDFQDTDSDNDGVSDLIEGGGDPSLDADNDGVIDDQTDTDGDGLADSVDPDNGGTAAGTPDSDGDGLPDYRDLDSDGDGINDVVEAGGADTDNNGQIDTGGTLLDGTNLPDSSGNGTPDVLEPNNPDLPGSLDANGDGVVDDQTDTDGDGIADSVDGLVGFGDAEQTDTDGDGIADIHDLDSDNDGILDSVEQNGDPNRDTDNDGIPDHLDLDSDGDGILDLVESGQDALVVDTNGDGVLDSTTDADNDGILDTADADDADVNAGGSTTPTDSDGDGTSDFQDVDSDNDGVSDLVEGGTDPNLDANNDGILDDQTDMDGDGLADSVDPDNGGTAAGTPDTDGDGLPDYQDLDSDGDGINDVVEAGGTDTDNNGQIDTGGTLLDGTNLPDSSGNGTPDVEEPNNPDLPGNLDLDGDGVIDDQTDSDGDGIADSVDGLDGFGDAEQTDTDGDGIADIHDLDSDNDGILDSVEQDGDPNRDTDGDGIPDHLDLDSDGDGILDLVESGQDAATLDADGDGMLDSTVDADNDGIVDTADNDDNDINAGGSTTPTDSDGDGMPDFQDTDSDNDGVSDLIEGGGDPSLDADNDGVIDDQTDTDGDGLADSVDPDNGGTASTGPDSDGDGLPDYQDLDSDGDGINDVDEAGGTDTDGDGQIDTGDLVDGNNLPDTDGDGTPDVEEPNNPDLPGNLDLDGDGVIDDQTDSDGDGIADSVDGLVGFGDAEQTDTDGDGIADIHDLDSDNDGILDSVEQDGDPNRDTDGDGIPDHLDLDSDGDGILDIVESGQDAATLDADGDGMLDSTVDADNDGIVDTADNDDNDINAGGSTTPTDSDGDGMPDFQDTDSDNDGVSDLIEGGGDPSLDTDNDGVIDDQTDTDGDGLADSVDPDNGGTSSTGPDTDGDGLPDYQDLDSDGDGINDVDEAGGTDTDGDGQIDTGDLVDGNNLPDTDGDGTPDVEEPNNPDLPGNLDLDGDGVIDDQTDSDGDGIADSVDGLVGFGDALTTDTDGDGIEDLYDLDSDNDGILDSVEQGGDPDRDTDGDGIPDHLDLDSDGDGILDLVESGQDASVVDTNGDGVLDSTTDADNDGIVDTADADDVDVNAGGSTNATDTDGDGNLDFQDLDSDNDGISDLIESGSDMNLDSDGDGMLDDQTDSDGDGLADSVDPDNGGSSPDIMDTDEDGNPDYQDLDSDNDGVTDLQEGGTDSSLDSDGDGVIDDISDSDGDGMMDSVDVDNGGDAPDMQDTDGDGTADYQDIDDDGDGVLTSEEDIDDDGNPNTDDTDGDGIPNYLDMDDDGDGIDTIDENPDNNGDGMPDDSLDTDEDGIPDYLDPDTLPCLTVYNEFTPNGDGQNDTFVISCIGDEMYKNNRLEVYNRWGSIVYSKSRYDNSWTGESNGRINFQVDEQLPSGTYYYVLDLGNGSEPKTGWIHINRK